MIYLIIYPLLTAFILAVIKEFSTKYLDLIVLGSFSVYLFLVSQVAIEAWSNSLEYYLGNWGERLGIRLHLASDGVFMICLIAVLTYLILIYCSSYIKRKKAKYYILILILTASLMGLVLTRDFFNLYVFFEIASIASYALAAVNKSSDSFEGVLKYLVIGSFGGMFILLAIILSYKLTGTLDLAQLAIQVENFSSFHKFSIMSLLFIGFGSKIALVPLHPWMPDVYNSANITFNTLSSALIIKTVLYSLVKLLYNIFGTSFFGSQLQLIVLWWGVITFLTAHLLAYQQKNIKRLLAYSSAAHIGYLVTVFSLGSKDGLIAGNFHLLNHALMKSSLFLLSGIFAYYINSYNLDDWKGLGHQFPYRVLLFSGVSFAMVGLPPFNGFMSKWLMIRAILAEGYTIIAFTILIGTVLSLAYYLKIIWILYSTPESIPESTIEPKRITVVTTLLASSCLILGLFPNPILNLIDKTAILLGG
ncbi:MAG: proton-conducting transporter membrane subunit [Halanaerobacter sp.]